MLVLNTTSPRASPWAPAAAPRNQVPSSSARIASISPTLYREDRKGRREKRFLGVLNVLRGCLLSFQRRRDPVLFARDDADGRGPLAVAVVLESNHVRPGAHRRQRHRRLAHRLVVHEHSGSG